MGRKGRKVFFFEKKKQKTFATGLRFWGWVTVVPAWVRRAAPKGSARAPYAGKVTTNRVP
jgi:hypothetical protein